MLLRQLLGVIVIEGVLYTASASGMNWLRLLPKQILLHL